MPSNQLLSAEVKEALVNKLEASSWDIDIEVNQGTVVLTGIVDVLWDKMKAEEIVRRVPGVAGVENLLTIAMEGAPTDLDIRREVEERLSHVNDEEAQKLSVEVGNGIVTLIGLSEDLESLDRAKEVSSQVIGVKDVILRAKVQTERQDDATLKNAVALALSQGAANISEVDFEVRESRAILNGYAQTARERDVIEAVIRSVAGVKKIKNNLKIRNDRDIAGDYLH